MASLSRRSTILYIIVLTLLVACAEMQGALTLTINTVDETFSLSASDTGTPFEIPGQGNFIVWSLSGLDAVTNTVRAVYDDDTTWETSVGTPGGGASYDTEFTYFADGVLELTLISSTSGSQTITGLGVAKPYSGFEADAKTAISKITSGTNFLLLAGTDFGVATIVVVPEPATIAPLMAMAALGVVGWQRRTRKQDILSALENNQQVKGCR